MDQCERRKPVYNYFHLKSLSLEDISLLKDFLDELNTSYEVYEWYNKTNFKSEIVYQIGSDFYGSVDGHLYENCYIVHKYSFKNRSHKFFIMDDIDFKHEFKKFKKDKFIDDLSQKDMDLLAEIEKKVIKKLSSKNNGENIYNII